MRPLIVLILLATSLPAAEPCRVNVVDKDNRWPVPLVELRTTDSQRFVSDNAGVIALDAPDLMNRESWFSVIGHGYEVKADGFDYRGVKLTPVQGKTLTVEVTRTNIAKRIGRLTGGGLFAEAQKCGDEKDWIDGPIVGCDSVQMATLGNKRFWLWGDTTLAGYPLGIFDASAATTPLQPWAKLEPPLKPKYDYFTTDKGKPRGVAKMPGSGPTWIFGMATVKDGDKDRLVGTYMKVRNHLEVYEYGQCIWSEPKAEFEKSKVLWTKTKAGEKEPVLPQGHPVPWTDAAGKDWLLFGNPLPTIQCPATLDGWQDPKQWTTLKPQAELLDPDGKKVVPHSGSIAWHPWRKKWLTVFMEKFGKPSAFGELWYAESDSPLGPWGVAVKVLTHANYTFYNPRVHAELATADSPALVFEGTYTAEFAKDPPPTARHNYNQILYRLDLDDPMLANARK
jgi:hypothetical protein